MTDKLVFTSFPRDHKTITTRRGITIIAITLASGHFWHFAGTPIQLGRLMRQLGKYAHYIENARPDAIVEWLCETKPPLQFTWDVRPMVLDDDARFATVELHAGD